MDFSTLPFASHIKSSLVKGEIITISHVETLAKGKKQKLNFKMAGLHKKSCLFALRKLSLYENYHQYLNFTKKSSYDEKRQRVNFHLHSPLLPFDMVMNFKLPRIKKIGTYPIHFDRGILDGLQGKIHVSSYKHQCLFYLHARWEGKHTGISNTIFEFFSSALSKLAMRNLFRMSSVY